MQIENYISNSVKVCMNVHASDLTSKKCTCSASKKSWTWVYNKCTFYRCTCDIHGMCIGDIYTKCIIYSDHCCNIEAEGVKHLSKANWPQL